MLGRPLSLPVLLLSPLPLLLLLSSPWALPLLIQPLSLALLKLLSGTVAVSVSRLVPRPLSLPASYLRSLLLLPGLLFIPACASKLSSSAVRGLPAAGGAGGRGKKNRLAE